MSTFYCVECLTAIHSFGIPAENLYIAVCRHKDVFDDYMELCDCPHCQRLKMVSEFLERKGYLISCDSDIDTFKVKPNIIETHGSQMYCSGLHCEAEK